MAGVVQLSPAPGGVGAGHELRRETRRDELSPVARQLKRTRGRSSGPDPPILGAVTGTREAAFFDLDKTVIAKSSTLAFSRPFYKGGLVNRRAVLKSSYAQFVYLLQGADDEQMERMREYLKVLCAGWPVQQVRDIVAETLHQLIDPVVYAEAVALFDDHHAAGRDVVLVSSSGEEVVGPIGDMLGVDRVVATRMVVKDGRYTGDIAFYAYGEGKADALRELAAEHGYDLSRCWAYSDSVTDLPMLSAVGHPHAVNPDRALRRVSTERGWPVLNFSRPVRARDRFGPLPAPPGPPAAYLAGVFAGAAGLAWWATRRPSRTRRPSMTWRPSRT